MRNYVQGDESVDLTAPSGGVTAGLAYKIGALIVIAAATVAQNLSFCGYRRGVFDVVTDTGAAWSEGDTIYWDNTNHVFTKTSTSNTKCALCVAAKGSSAAVGRIVLVPSI